MVSIASPDEALAPLAVLAFEELRQHGSNGLCGDVVGLTGEGAALCMGEGVRDRLCGVAQPWGLPAVNDERGDWDSGYPLGRQREVSGEDGVVDERMRQSLLRRPKSRLSHRGDHFDRKANRLGHEELDHVASPTRRQQLGELLLVILPYSGTTVADDVRPHPPRQFL